MRLHEYEAKEIFRNYNINIPRGEFVENPKEAREAALRLGLPVVIKSQTLVGGRGKAGGIRICEDEGELEKTARAVKELEIKGYRATGLLIEEKLDIEKELYCGITIDRNSGKPVVMLSSRGGIDIEEVALQQPESIVSFPVILEKDYYPFEILSAVKDLGLSGRLLPEVTAIVIGLLRVFKEFDCLITEVNPIVITRDERVVCADAVIQVDDSALFRHPELYRKKISKLGERDLRIDKKGATYVRLEGNVGLICSGAGLAMSTMDMIREYPRLSPANFLETGGAITAELMADCLEIILEQPGLKGILINLYGGINPIHEGARGLARVIKEQNVQIPIVAKALGNRQEETWSILEEAGVHITKATQTRKMIEQLANILGVDEK